MFCAGYAVYMWSLVDGWSQLYILKCDELILSIGKWLVAFFFCFAVANTEHVRYV